MQCGATGRQRPRPSARPHARPSAKQQQSRSIKRTGKSAQITLKRRTSRRHRRRARLRAGISRLALTVNIAGGHVVRWAAAPTAREEASRDVHRARSQRAATHARKGTCIKVLCGGARVPAHHGPNPARGRRRAQFRLPARHQVRHQHSHHACTHKRQRRSGREQKQGKKATHGGCTERIGVLACKTSRAEGWTPPRLRLDARAATAARHADPAQVL